MQHPEQIHAPPFGSDSVDTKVSADDGGPNRDLIGLFDFNPVAYLFGEVTTLAQIIYILAGVSALHSICLSAKNVRHC